MNLNDLRKLGDTYWLKARVFPATVALLPLSGVALTSGAKPDAWLSVLLQGSVAGMVLVYALSHVASLAGNRFQKKLWPDWPHDAPTHTRLRSQSRDISQQGRQQLWAALNQLTGIDLAATSETEERLAINDAVTQLRNLLVGKPEAKWVLQQNIDFGFARNLAGLRSVFVILSLGSCLVSCWLVWRGQGAITGAVTSGVVLAVSALLAHALPGYVRVKAGHYADALFSAALALVQR